MKDVKVGALMFANAEDLQTLTNVRSTGVWGLKSNLKTCCYGIVTCTWKWGHSKGCK